MEVSQYNQLCQVFATGVNSLSHVFNTPSSVHVTAKHKLLIYNALTSGQTVDIVVDKSLLSVRVTELDSIF